LEKTVALRETAANQIATALARAARELIGLRPKADVRAVGPVRIVEPSAERNVDEGGLLVVNI
jgi:hypothetical protein